MKHIVVEVVK